MALELITLVAQWFPNDEIIVSGDSAYGVEASSLTCRPTFTSSAMCIPMEHSTSRRLPRKQNAKDRPAKRGPVARHEAMGRRSDRPWTKLEFNQFGLHTTLEVKTIQALYYKAGKDRLLTIVLRTTWKGNAPIRCSIVPSLMRAFLHALCLVGELHFDLLGHNDLEGWPILSLHHVHQAALNLLHVVDDNRGYFLDDVEVVLADLWM